MSFKTAQQSRLLLGAFSLSAFLRNLETTSETDMLDATVFTSSAKESIPGLNTSKLTAGGLLEVDGAATSLLGRLNTWKSTGDTPISYAPSGLSLGSELILVASNEAQIKVTAKLGEVVSFNLDGQTDGFTDVGVSLHDLSAETADVSGTGVDGVASTTTGGVAHLHVTAFSGFSSAVVIVEDSANNSSFSTIGTFSTVSGLTSERLTIAGTIRRYTRYSVDVTGSGSITFSVGLARR